MVRCHRCPEKWTALFRSPTRQIIANVQRTRHSGAVDDPLRTRTTTLNDWPGQETEAQAAFAARVTKAREGRGWSRRVLAANARLSPETVAAIERGSVDPRLSTVRRLAGALEVSASYLAFG